MVSILLRFVWNPIILSSFSAFKVFGIENIQSKESITAERRSSEQIKNPENHTHLSDFDDSSLDDHCEDNQKKSGDKKYRNKGYMKLSRKSSMPSSYRSKSKPRSIPRSKSTAKSRSKSGSSHKSGRVFTGNFDYTPLEDSEAFEEVAEEESSFEVSEDSDTAEFDVDAYIEEEINRVDKKGKYNRKRSVSEIPTRKEVEESCNHLKTRFKSLYQVAIGALVLSVVLLLIVFIIKYPLVWIIGFPTLVIGYFFLRICFKTEWFRHISIVQKYYTHFVYEKTSSRLDFITNSKTFKDLIVISFKVVDEKDYRVLDKRQTVIALLCFVTKITRQIHIAAGVYFVCSF